jgi:invasion protein IalB
MLRLSHWHVIAGFAAALATQAAADTRPPQRTTATYEDWTERCEVRAGANVCEMAQAMEIRDQAQPITQIAIGQESKSAPVKIVFQVPINVWLPTGVKLSLNENDPGVVAEYSRCLPTSCLAETELKDDQIKALRAAKENGRLQFKDAVQRDVIIPVSFKGFEQAYQAIRQP